MAVHEKAVLAATDTAASFINYLVTAQAGVFPQTVTHNHLLF